MCNVMIENSKQLDYKQMSISDIIEDEARNIEYTVGLWYCYLIHEFFDDSIDKFYEFVDRVKSNNRIIITKNEIQLIQLCLSESLLREIANEKITVSTEQIISDNDLMQEFKTKGRLIKNCRVNIYTKVKDKLLKDFKYCEERYIVNGYPMDQVFPYALEAVNQHYVMNIKFQKVKIPTLYFPFKDTFERMYSTINKVFKLTLNDNCLAKLHKLFDTFNLNFDDAIFSYNMAKVKRDRKNQDFNDELSKMEFKSAVNNEEVDIDEFLEETLRLDDEDIERKYNKKSDFLKRLEKIGDAIINSKSDSDEKLFEKHKTTCSNQDEEDYWYLYDQFHDSFGNYHKYGK